MVTASTQPRRDGLVLLGMLQAAGGWLQQNAAAVDALNVFPVPDGDTGSNMALTMQAALEAGAHSQSTGAGDVAAAIARGALLGARGNSGVILSQVLRGISEALEGRETAEANDLAAGLRAAATRAYASMSDPREGTLLTVVRRAAERAETAAAAGSPLDRVLAASLAEARQALAETPQLLPVLREAGVVDAGGQGFVLLLEGSLAFLEGRDLGAAYETLGQIDVNWLQATADLHAGGHDGSWGYCTQFLIEEPSADEAAVRAAMEALGSSVLVVGERRTLRVHLHTLDPGAALSRGVALGSLDGIKIDNMTLQQQKLLETARTTQPQLPVPVVTVAPGPGIAQVFHGLGAARVVPGGQSMNPSAQQLLEAVEGVAGDAVILLPNNRNVEPVCHQVQQLTDKRIWVVPSHTVAQGVAALLALRPMEPVDRNATVMREAMGSVHSIEVTRATRDATVEGRPVAEGEALGFLDRALTAADPSDLRVLHDLLDRLDAGEGALVTLYYGAAVTADAAREVAAALSARADRPEVEMVWGGQPHYQYVGSVET